MREKHLLEALCLKRTVRFLDYRRERVEASNTVLRAPDNASSSVPQITASRAEVYCDTRGFAMKRVSSKQDPVKGCFQDLFCQPPVCSMSIRASQYSAPLTSSYWIKHFAVRSPSSLQLHSQPCVAWWYPKGVHTQQDTASMQSLSLKLVGEYCNNLLKGFIESTVICIQCKSCSTIPDATHPCQNWKGSAHPVHWITSSVPR